MRVQSHLQKDGFPGLYNVRVLIREDGCAASGSEWYYKFVRENSRLSLFEMIAPEDAKDLQDTIREALAAGDACEPGVTLLELITTLDNKLGDVYPYVHLRIEKARTSEMAKPLFEVHLTDMLESRDSIIGRQEYLEKYRFYLALKQEIYFDYAPSTNVLSVFRYINGVSFSIYYGDLDAFLQKYRDEGKLNEADALERAETVVRYLKSKELSFCLNVFFTEDGHRYDFQLRGGSVRSADPYCAGVLTPSEASKDEPYYMTEAALDAGTGIFNKRAITEYVIEHLGGTDGKAETGTCWLMIIDVDDFKNINDNFGHAFGDEVVRYVAETLQKAVKNRGMVGRFGGDEFMVFLNKAPTREALKDLLKPLAKDLLLAFDPKFTLTISVGVSCYPKDGSDFETLFAKADKCVYIAKEKGKNRHIIYDEELHGALDKNSMETQAVAYTISNERRRRKIEEILIGLSMEGSAYLLGKPERMDELRAVLDVDGVSITSADASILYAVSGRYIKATSDEDWNDPAVFAGMFDDAGFYVENNVAALKDIMPQVYRGFAEFEIGASVVVTNMKDGKPGTMVHFDVFNKRRKWSERELEYMGFLGKLIVTLIDEGR
ncbi:MAG: GGDEF domain-containing protein [Lachnospiraceae bacterium]|nr:GGDEF domain-containing protein [Lachnospiraceae bacterium]